MARNAQLLALLGKSRDMLDQLFSQIVALGASGSIPCSAISAHTAMRDRLVQLDASVIQQLRAAGGHPPEDAPKYPHGFGACPPGLDDIPFAPPQQEQAKAVIGEGKKKALVLQAALDNAQKKAPQTLGPLIAEAMSAVRAPVVAEPRYMLAFGGTIWPVTETRRLLDMPLGVTERDAYGLAGEIAQSLQAVGTLAGPVVDPQAPPPRKKWVLPVAIGGGVLGVLGGGTALWYGLRKPPGPAYHGGGMDDGDDTEEQDDGGMDDGTEGGSGGGHRSGSRRARRRNRRSHVGQ